MAMKKALTVSRFYMVLNIIVRKAKVKEKAK